MIFINAKMEFSLFNPNPKESYLITGSADSYFSTNISGTVTNISVVQNINTI